MPGGETTIFVYDAGGALVAEYSTAPLPSNPTTSYLTTDHLGSPRVITDQSGSVIARRDFMPFGEELGVGAGPRTESLKYSYTGSDTIRKRFTGYERDDETGLDFAEARMYRNGHGRFTAPDPLLGSASAANPQTFNRYAYTGNDPVNYTDPSGLKWIQNSEGNVRWVADNNYQLTAGEQVVDGSILRLVSGSGGFDVNGTAFGVESFVRFNANGTRTVVSNPSASESAQITASTGAEVQASQADVPAANAEELAVGSSEIATTITTRGGGFAPCPSGALGCGSGNAGPSVPDLTHGASAEEVVDAAQIVLDAAAASEVPLVSHAAGAASIIIDVVKGDLVGAGLGAAGLIPIIGNAADVAKIARRADKAIDRARDAKRAFSTITDTTIGKSVINVTTDSTPLGVAKTLKKNGFAVSRSADRKALNFQKGESKYSLRLNSKSTQGPTFEFFKGNERLRKIRLSQ